MRPCILQCGNRSVIWEVNKNTSLLELYYIEVIIANLIAKKKNRKWWECCLECNLGQSVQELNPATHKNIALEHVYLMRLLHVLHVRHFRGGASLTQVTFKFYFAHINTLVCMHYQSFAKRFSEVKHHK